MFFGYAWLYLGETLHFPRAISDLLRLHAHPVEQCKPQVALRRLDAGIYHVPPGLDASIAAAQKETGHIVMQVLIRVAHAAAINDHRVIEQRSVSIPHRFQRLDERRELFHVMAFDPGSLLDQLRSAA